MKDNKQMFRKFLILLSFITPLLSCDSKLSKGSISNPEFFLENVIPYGLTYYSFKNTKGIVLCLHGTGGSAQGWTSGDKVAFLNNLSNQGYGFVCPTSVDRTTKQWSATNTSSNADVQNIDTLLFHLGFPSNIKLFPVGHSNGGGFVSRYSVFSLRSSAIAAVQYSNSSGINAILTDPAYTYPSLFSYADCDPLVNATDVRNNQMALTSKAPPVTVLDHDIDAVYSAGNYSDCHEFANTGTVTGTFFDSY